MKQKLTITVDAEVLPVAKRYARSRGVSLSSLVEQSLREMAREETPTSPPVGEASFGRRDVKMTRVTKHWLRNTSVDTFGHRRSH